MRRGTLEQLSKTNIVDGTVLSAHNLSSNKNTDLSFFYKINHQAHITRFDYRIVKGPKVKKLDSEAYRTLKDKKSKLIKANEQENLDIRNLNW